MILIGVGSQRLALGHEAGPTTSGTAGVWVLNFHCGGDEAVVRQTGLVLRLVAGKRCALAPGQSGHAPGFGSVRPTRGGLRVQLDASSRPSWSLGHDRLTFSSSQLPTRLPPAIVPAGSALVPGLPMPFIASVEGQVSRMLSTPPQIAPRLGPAANPNVVGEKAGIRPAAGASRDEIASGAGGDIDLGASSNTGLAVMRRGQRIDIFVDRPVPTPTNQSSVPGIRITPVDRGSWVEVEPSLAEVRRLRIVDGRWVLGRAVGLEPGPAIELSRATQALGLGVPHPGRVMVVPDPTGGAALLVGTVRDAIDPMSSRVRTPLAEIAETEDGVVVRPWSSRVVLRLRASGFDLALDDEAPDQWLASTGVDPRLISRSSLFPDLGAAALWRTLRSDEVADSLTPERERGHARLTVAAAMIALGLIPEAGAVLRTATMDDPGVVDDSRYDLLRSIVDALAPTSGADLANETRSDRSDEASAWRAMGVGTRDSAAIGPRAASNLARVLVPVIDAYPAPLRELASDRLLSFLLDHGGAADLPIVGQLPPTPQRELAIALFDERLGRPASAASKLDQLVQGDDPVIATRSLFESIRLQAARGSISDAAAADEIERHQLDWRLIGATERATLAEADLRARAGQLRAAFKLCRALENGDATTRTAAEALLVRYLGDVAVRGAGRQIPAPEIVGALAENEAWIEAHPGLARRLEPILAERLAAVGLPAEAADVLARVLPLQQGDERAAFGLRIASLKADAGQIDAGQAMLEQVARAGVPAALTAQGALIGARLAVASGKDAEATTLLAGQSGDQAAELRATIAEHRRDWKAAEQAMEPLVQRLRPLAHLDPAQSALVLRLATAASRSGDADLTADCARRFAPRLSDQSSRDTLVTLASS